MSKNRSAKCAAHARRRAILLVSAASLLGSASLTMASDDTATWDSTNASWSATIHWNHSNPGAIGLVPNNGGLTYDVVVNGGTVTQDFGLVTINALTLNLGNITGGSVTVENGGNWAGGSMLGTGTTTIDNSASFQISGAGDKGLQRTIANNGTTTWTAGRIIFLGGTINNSGTFDAQANSTFFDNGGTNTFNNSGLLLRTAGIGSAAMDIVVNNTGTINVSSGTLALTNGGTSTGKFITGNVGDIRFGGATHALNGVSVTGTGTTEFSGGTALFNASSVYSMLGTTAVTGGTVSFAAAATTSQFVESLGNLTGTGTFNVQGIGSWTGGSMLGAGTTIFSNTSSVSISGTADKGLLRNLINNGAITWTGGRLDVNGGTITNNGTFDHQADATFDNFGVGAFINNGTFTRTLGTGSALYNLTFVNSGNVAVNTGTLVLNAGGTYTGNFAITTPATLNFAAGTHVFNSGSMTGTGAVDLSSGNGTYTFATGYALNNATTNLIGGNVNGTGTLTIPNVLNWTGGSMIGAGTTILSNTAVASISAAGDKGLQRNLINNGLITWTLGRIDLLGGTLTNNQTFDNESNAVFEDFGGLNAFVNNGTFTRTVNTGTTTIDTPFFNNGTVSVSTGTMVLNEGGTYNGNFTVTTPATLNFAGGTHLFNSGTLGGTGVIGMTSSIGTYSFPNSFSLGSATTNFVAGNMTGVSTITLPNVMNWTGGSMIGAGTTNNTGSLIITGASDKGLSRYLINNGTAVWNLGRIDVTSGTFINNGKIDIQVNSFFEGFSGVNAFINSGTLTRTVGTGSVDIDTPFANSGTVNISAGTLYLDGGGTYTGNFSVTAPATLSFGSGTHLFNGGTMGGAGVVGMVSSAGTYTFQTPYTLNAATTNFVAGNLNGTLSVAAAKVLNWTGGSMIGVGTTIINSTGVLNISGTSDKGLSRYITNNGSTVWTQGRMNVTGGTFTNNGSMDAQVNSSFQDFSGSNAFINNGTFSRTTGTGSMVIDTTLVNNGTINANSGTLWFDHGQTTGGTYNIGTIGLLSVAGTNTFTSGSVFSGAGTLAVASGITTFSGTHSVSNTYINGGAAHFTALFNSADNATVSVTNALLELHAGGNSGGTFITGTSGTLKLDGTHNFNATSNIGGVGTVDVAIGTAIIGGTYNNTNTRIEAGAVMAFTSGTKQLFQTKSLQLTGVAGAWTSKLDLADDDAIIDYTGVSPIQTIRDQLKLGRGTGNWSGNGITTSQGNLHNFGMAFGEASTLGLAAFDNVPVDPTSIVMKYTFDGDANLDGKVDIKDLYALALHFNATTQLWTGGDFNYDGTVNASDLSLLAFNWQAGTGAPSAPAGFEAALVSLGLPEDVAVPEPLTLIPFVGLYFLTRRRRNRV